MHDALGKSLKQIPSRSLLNLFVLCQVCLLKFIHCLFEFIVLRSNARYTSRWQYLHRLSKMTIQNRRFHIYLINTHFFAQRQIQKDLNLREWHNGSMRFFVVFTTHLKVFNCNNSSNKSTFTPIAISFDFAFSVCRKWLTSWRIIWRPSLLRLKRLELFINCRHSQALLLDSGETRFT